MTAHDLEHLQIMFVCLQSNKGCLQQLATCCSATCARYTELHSAKSAMSRARNRYDQFFFTLSKSRGAPVMHWLEEVGRPYWAAMVMIRAVASSAAKPLVGEILASLTPMALQTAFR